MLLLKSRDNKSSNDELYPDKLKTYAGKGTIFTRTLTKDFMKKYNLNFKPYDTFGPLEIEERHKLLFDLVTGGRFLRLETQEPSPCLHIHSNNLLSKNC